LTYLSGPLSHRTQRRIRRKLRNGFGKIFVERIAALLLNLTGLGRILVAMRRAERIVEAEFIAIVQVNFTARPKPFSYSDDKPYVDFLQPLGGIAPHLQWESSS
jgi:hypothetical protein